MSLWLDIPIRWKIGITTISRGTITTVVLINAGVPASQISAVGRVMSAQIKFCDKTPAGEKLHEFLGPNRRVEYDYDQTERKSIKI